MNKDSRLTFRIDSADNDELDRIAKEQGCSKSKIIRRAIEELFDAHGIKPDKKVSA